MYCRLSRRFFVLALCTALFLLGPSCIDDPEQMSAKADTEPDAGPVDDVEEPDAKKPDVEQPDAETQCEHPEADYCPEATEAGGACVFLDDDPDHCGECGNACSEDEICEDGSCQDTSVCPDPDSPHQCGDECVDLDSDPDNCGACDVQCFASCVDGACDASEFGDCDASESIADREADGTSEDPHLICAAEHLAQIPDETTDYFLVVDDIDMADYLSVQPFEPIEDFGGKLYGDGHTISNLRIATGDDTALFSQILDEGLVKLLHFEEVDISGGNRTATVAARNEGEIVDIEVSGEVRSYGIQVGGLVAENRGRLVSSSCAGKVVGNQRVGGLAGDGSGIIEDSHSSCNILAPGGQAGGLVGVLSGEDEDDGDSALIENSHATGDVIITGELAGGLAGVVDGAQISHSSAEGGLFSTANNQVGFGGLVGRLQQGVISDSEARGAVSAPDDRYVGGLVGEMRDSRIANSLATGDVIAHRRAGGLVGDLHRSDADYDQPDVYESQAEGNVVASRSAAGLVGRMSGHALIDSSRAWGDSMGGDDHGQVAGLVGTANDDSSVYSSFAAGDVYGEGDNVGGLVGRFDRGTIADSEAEGAVSGMGSSVGGLAGRVGGGGRVQNSRALGDVSAVGYYVGGLIGDHHNQGEILESFAEGDVFGGGNYVGGLVGRFGNGLIEHSGAKGDAVGAAYNVGGLVGRVGGGGRIIESYARGNVSGNEQNIGGLVGHYHEGGEIEDSYAEGNVSGFRNIGGLVGRLDNNEIKNSRASGSVYGARRVGGLVGQMNNDSTITDSYAEGDASSDGDGSWGQTAGLVGTANDNASIYSSWATGDVDGAVESTGGLVGRFGNGELIDSYATGDITGDEDVGGLIGKTRGGGHGHIEGSHAEGSVRGTRRVGGLVGRVRGTAEVHSSYALGDVNVDGGGADQIGGLVGFLQGNTEIHTSFATGDVNAPQFDRVGGLVGYANGRDIHDSYATGAVTGNDSVGGLIGEHGNGDVERCYSAGPVTGNSDEGGLVGDNDDVDDSYWDTETSGQDESDGGQGLTTGDFANPERFGDWNFVDSPDDGSPDEPWYMPEHDELDELTGDTENIRPRLWFEFLGN